MKELPKAQNQQLENLKEEQYKVGEMWISYWKEYSFWDTWQFWVCIAFIVLPLVLLYFTIDRKRIFLLGFFGFNIHIWLVYLDAVTVRFNFIEYPYKAIPVIPIHFGVDTSLVPVLFILLYQWIMKRKKSFYLYSFLLVAALSFILIPILSYFHFLHLKNGSNYMIVFFGYLLVLFISKGITNLFIYLYKKEG